MKMKLIVEKDGGVVKHISMHIKYSSLEEDIFFGDQQRSEVSQREYQVHNNENTGHRVC